MKKSKKSTQLTFEELDSMIDCAIAKNDGNLKKLVRNPSQEKLIRLPSHFEEAYQKTVSEVIHDEPSLKEVS
ncbi:hypothetical protein WDW89_24845 [Deltaproteobacteria bacterium TL4]